jgi:hypothetical protein
MVPGSIWQQFMNTALRAKPVEQFSKFVPLGTPPDSEFSDASSSEDPDSEDGDRGSRRHRDDFFGGQDACDFVACDSDGNPVGGLGGNGRRGRDSDFGDN